MRECRRTMLGPAGEEALSRRHMDGRARIGRSCQLYAEVAWQGRSQDLLTNARLTCQSRERRPASCRPAEDESPTRCPRKHKKVRDSLASASGTSFASLLAAARSA